MPRPGPHDTPACANLDVVDNAHAQFACMAAANASCNTTCTNTPEETQSVSPAAEAA